MQPFKNRRRGGLHAVFEPGEAAIIANLTRQMIELLRDRNGPEESDEDPLAAEIGWGGPATAPEDPVLRRLLPNAYTDDEDESAEFRRYTERSLTAGKVANAETVIALLHHGGLPPAGTGDNDVESIEVELGSADAVAWLRTLTDIRLALAVRLGIETDEDIEAVSESEDDGVQAMAEIYDWLGYVQESLVLALD